MVSALTHLSSHTLISFLLKNEILNHKRVKYTVVTNSSLNKYNKF